MAVSLIHRVFVGVALCTLVALGFPVSAAAQGRNTAEVSGAIRDASGGVLPGALVEGVIGGRAISSVTTGADGRYRLSVPAGVPFEIQVHLEGFAA
jgi:hypothetical protein